MPASAVLYDAACGGADVESALGLTNVVVLLRLDAATEAGHRDHASCQQDPDCA